MKYNAHIHIIMKIITITTCTTNIQIYHFKRCSTSYIHYSKTTTAQHTKQGKKQNVKIITILRINIIPTFNINIHFDHFNTKSHILNTFPTYKYIHFRVNQHSCARGPLRECRSIQSGASGLPYYCAWICVRFGCTRRASCVDSKPKKKCMCVRMPLSLGSITGVFSRQALPGYLITAHHLCAFLMCLAR